MNASEQYFPIVPFPFERFLDFVLNFEFFAFLAVKGLSSNPRNTSRKLLPIKT